MKRKLSILAAVLLASCSTSEEVAPVADGVARFSSDISTRVSTDLSEPSSAWVAGDQIGIYMYMQETGVYTQSNYPYAAKTSGTATTFEAVDDKITLPNSGGVAFVAYSPYSSELSEDAITIDLSDQSTAAKRDALDFMVSDFDNNSESFYTYEDSGTAIPLKFNHKLAIIKLNVAKGENVESLSGLACEISGLTAILSYSVTGGVKRASDAGVTGAITMLSEVAADGSSATLSAIVHPYYASSGTYSFTFTLGAQVYTTTITGEIVFEANKIYEYETTIGNAAVTFGENCTISDWTSDSSFSSSSLVSSDVLLDMVYNNGVYEIYTAAGLYAFADLVNGDYNTSASVYWGSGEIQGHSGSRQLDIDGKLMADVDLGGNESNQWTAIGSSNSSYTGTFDGDGHLISGLYISGSSNYQGLFGCVDSGGVVKSVGVSGEVKGGIFVGGVMGVNYGSVTNCYNTAEVSGTIYVGGVVGSNLGSVMNCYNTAAVSGTSSVGGVVGYNESGSSVTNCYNMAAVTGSSSVGGVVGNNSSGSVTSCYWVDVADDDADSGLGNGTGDTSTITSDATEDATFTETLNAQVSGEMCLWAWSADVNGGYPTLDFGSYAD